MCDKINNDPQCCLDVRPAHPTACDICVPDAICTLTNESYICACPDGFTGDGRWTPVGTGCRGQLTIVIIISQLLS